MDEEAEPGQRIAEGRQALQELLHEGSGMLNEDTNVDQGHLLVLNTHTHSKVFSRQYLDVWRWQSYRPLVEEQQIVVTDATTVLKGPCRWHVITQVVQLQLHVQMHEHANTNTQTRSTLASSSDDIT